MPEFLANWLFHFTEWLRTTWMNDFALWLSNTRLSLFFSEHWFLIPGLQTIHIASIAMGFVSVLMVSFRVLRFSGNSLTVTQTVDRYLAWIWRALGMLVLSGIFLVISEPVRDLVNPIFWPKIVGVILVFLVSAGFAHTARSNAAAWQSGEPGSGVRAAAVGIILLWLFIILCGRWIAYAPV
jgi:hypothetical protein